MDEETTPLEKVKGAGEGEWGVCGGGVAARLLAASEQVVEEWWCWGVGVEQVSLWESSPLTRSAMKGSMMSEALLLLAREEGASRSQAPPWNTSEQEVGGASSLCEEWRIRPARDVSVIGGSSRSGNLREMKEGD